MKDMSIVLGTYNRKDLLLACIRSVQLASKGLDIEIIINDAGSDDGTVPILKKWNKLERFKIIFSKEKTCPTQAYNQCFRIATGKYVTWFSDDLVAQGKSIIAMFEFMEKQDRKTLGAFYMKNANQQNMIKAMLAHQQRLNNSTDPEEKEELQAKVDRINRALGFSVPEFKGQLCPSVGCINTMFLKEIGLWNTDYPFYGQDVDLNFRILRNGGKIAGCPSAKIIHNVISDDLKKHNVAEGRKGGDDRKFQLISQRFGETCDKSYPKILFKLNDNYNYKIALRCMKKVKKMYRNSHLFHFGEDNGGLLKSSKEITNENDKFDMIVDISSKATILFPDDLELTIKRFAKNNITGEKVK